MGANEIPEAASRRLGEPSCHKTTVIGVNGSIRVNNSHIQDEQIIGIHS